MVCDADGRSDDGSLLYSTIFGLTTKRATTIGPFEQLHAVEWEGDTFTVRHVSSRMAKTDAGDATDAGVPG